MNPKCKTPHLVAMLSRPLMFFLFPLYLLLIISSMFSITQSDDPEYLGWGCDNINITFPTSYQANLRNVFSSLISNAGTQEDGFYYNISKSTKSGFTVYGLFLCRADATPPFCRTCVRAAVDSLKTECPTAFSAVVYYDLCIVRYSNMPIFGQYTSTWSLPPLLGPINVTTNLSGFQRAVKDTMIELEEKAANGRPKKYATGKAFVGGSQPVYVMEQCTPDLSVSDCSHCLVDVVQQLVSCCLAVQSVNILYPSCFVRFEIYQFYEIPTSAPTPLAAATPVAPPPSPMPPAPTGKQALSKKLVVSIVLWAAVAVLLISVIGFYLMIRKKGEICTST